MTFTPEVYAQIREGARRSAETIVPLAVDLFAPETVVDVGCGEGLFAEAFAARGCVVDAVDESVDGVRVVTDSEWGTPDEPGVVTFHHADLTGNAWAYHLADLRGSFDLAVCLEVAEHLPPDASGGFVATLCELAPLVLFSAAVPGQGGHGHLNEQPPAYWVERFERHGFVVTGALRWRIWGDETVEPWYRQNLLVAAADASVIDGWADSPPVYVVHPTVWEHRRQRP